MMPYYTSCNLEENTILAKIDIKSAFRLLPVHLADRHLLVMNWRNDIYIDHCIPLGLRSAPKLFNILADLLAWIAQNAGISYLIHYLDDYLTMGPPSSTVCQHNVNTFLSLCAQLGVTLATDKVECPSTSLSFLGIILDSHHVEIRPTIRQADSDTAIVKNIAFQQKGSKATDFVASGHPTTWSGMTRRSLCCQDVCHSSQTLQNALHYSSFPVRFVLVACLLANLEWA